MSSRFMTLKKGLILAAALISFSACTDENKTSRYTGSSEGYGGNIKVEVSTNDKVITDIEIVSHNETKGIGDLALTKIPSDIVKYQSIEVDTVAGSTITSFGIMEAVEVALKDSDLDMDALLTPAKVELEIPVIENTTADVIVIGAGGAGLASAVSAYENGAESVILLEKMPMIGGNTIRSGGAFNAVNPEKQEAQGIEDSVELFTKQTFEGGSEIANLELVETLTGNATDSVDWLESHGMVWRENIESVIGSMWRRTNQSDDVKGNGFITVLSNALIEQGGDIILNMEATELIKEDGRIVGIVAKDLNGKETKFTANKGVILATGGYGANIKMIKEYLGDGSYGQDDIPSRMVTTNQPGSTGDGIAMAEKVGSNLVDMEHVQLLPMPADRFGPTINVDDAIFVNKEGKRYIKEEARRDEICLATFEQTDGQYFMINDSQVLTEDRITSSGELVDDLVAKGTVVEADTIEELAKLINIDPEVLVNTVNNFNIAVDEKTDEFGRELWSRKLDVAPFFATLRFPAMHHTMGGIMIDEKTRVIGSNNQPIDGLFAAGEVTGGIHGANRLGGNALADIIVFGRIAGKSIME